MSKLVGIGGKFVNPKVGVLEYYLTHGVFARFESKESREAVAEFNQCDCCGEKGTLKYYGFKSERSGERVDISKCTNCGDENEF